MSIPLLILMSDMAARAPVNIKTSIFNLQYLSHLLMDFYATKISINGGKCLSDDI